MIFGHMSPLKLGCFDFLFNFQGDSSQTPSAILNGSTSLLLLEVLVSMVFIMFFTVFSLSVFACFGVRSNQRLQLQTELYTQGKPFFALQWTKHGDKRPNPAGLREAYRRCRAGVKLKAKLSTKRWKYKPVLPSIGECQLSIKQM